MIPDKQLELWYEGICIHDYENDQCCPDFSCCYPELLAPLEQRVLFRDRPELRNSLLIGFLCELFKNTNVYMTGTIEETN